MLSKSQRQPDCFGFAPFLVFVHDRHSSFDGNLVDGPRLVAGISDNNVDGLISNAVLKFLGELEFVGQGRLFRGFSFDVQVDVARAILVG
jgi:hypothetical protein